MAMSIRLEFDEAHKNSLAKLTPQDFKEHVILLEQLDASITNWATVGRSNNNKFGNNNNNNNNNNNKYHGSFPAGVSVPGPVECVRCGDRNAFRQCVLKTDQVCRTQEQYNKGGKVRKKLAGEKTTKQITSLLAMAERAAKAALARGQQAGKAAQGGVPASSSDEAAKTPPDSALTGQAKPKKQV